jgi:hypothetical protein
MDSNKKRKPSSPLPSSSLPTSPFHSSSELDHDQNLDSQSDTHSFQSDTHFPRFLTIQPSDTDLPISKLSPFVIEKCMNGLVGNSHSVKKLRDGTLLVEVQRKGQSDNLLKTTNFANIPVKIAPHRSLNSCKAIVRSRDLAEVEPSELLDGLRSQGVSEVRHIFYTKEGEKRKSNALILTFCTNTPPPNIKAGYLSIKTEPYIPNPLRCFNCQKFGHHKSACKHSSTCGRCGLPEHTGSECTKEPECVNCKGSHPAYASSCPMWKKEKKICEVKTLQNISYPEARKSVENLEIPGSSNTASYASVASATKKNYTSIATQTDLDLCTKCKTTEPVQNTTSTSSAASVSTTTQTIQQQSKNSITSTQTKTNNANTSKTATPPRPVLASSKSMTLYPLQSSNSTSKANETKILKPPLIHPPPGKKKNTNRNFQSLDQRFGNMHDMDEC